MIKFSSRGMNKSTRKAMAVLWLYSTRGGCAPWLVAASSTTTPLASALERSRRGMNTVASASSSSSLRNQDITSENYETLHVQVIHRHGDRSPITPLRDVEYWTAELVDDAVRAKIAQGTRILREGEPFVHAAGARGPFGKLSTRGLLQMVRVGNTLAEELTRADSLFVTPLFGTTTTSHTESLHSRPLLHPRFLRVYSTDFDRTILSVQGLLVGFFPDGIPTTDGDKNSELTIDVRHTPIMIPDPQPRRTAEQAALEAYLTQRPHVLQAERDHLPLAVHATTALHNLLDERAHEVKFGVVQEEVKPNGNKDNEEQVEVGDVTASVNQSIELEPLQWNQLAEITACLASRQQLPSSLTMDHVHAIAAHTAWRWFETLRDDRLIYLAMIDFVRRQMDIFQQQHPPSASDAQSLATTTDDDNSNNNNKNPLVTIWSAHDSTLIALMCAYRLERPAVWPEYASYLVMELIRHRHTGQRLVRFSLNGQRLRSQWKTTKHDDHDHEIDENQSFQDNQEDNDTSVEGTMISYDAIPLDWLIHKLETVGAQPSEWASVST